MTQHIVPIKSKYKIGDYVKYYGIRCLVVDIALVLSAMDPDGIPLYYLLSSCNKPYHLTRSPYHYRIKENSRRLDSYGVTVLETPEQAYDRAMSTV